MDWVRQRGQRPGGCSQPAAASHVHHVTHKARGGNTSVKDCVLLCPYRHLIVIPPVGLDAGPEPGRHHHRMEPRPDQGAAQPRTTRPRRVTPNVGSPAQERDFAQYLQVRRDAERFGMPLIVVLPARLRAGGAMR